ncbi:MAG TPA: glycosyltransferase family 39 protein [Terriglobales bacterium]|nr:glycosyltransferase family 39 protein [Terriglobales bacterium]
MATLVYLATATVIVHVLTGGQYGFQRDELATLEDARHLAWGYVAYPPVTPFFGRTSLELFGTSLAGFRLFAAVAQAVAVVLTGLMARELSGTRWAQVVAATAAVPFCLGGGTLMQYVSFDCLCWVLTAYFTLRLLKSDDPRWWIAIGGSIGLGMLSKYTMLFFIAGVVMGVLATDLRQHLKSKWLWCGVAVSVVIFLPNLIWQAQHNFVSLDFLQHIHARDVRQGRARGFLAGQLKLTLFAFPLWMAGLHFYLFSPRGKRYRMLGWMYVVPLLLFVIAKGREYYVAPAYPMLYAAGSVRAEAWLESLGPPWAGILRPSVWTALVVDIAIAAALTLPLAPVNSAWFKMANEVNGDFQREEIGWPELVETVAHIRDSLPTEDRVHLGILATNYGEAGAVNLYGTQYGLPRAISGVNSFWEQGYGNPPPQVVIVLGLPREFVEKKFAACQLAAHSWNRSKVPNEETVQHPDIFVCRGLLQSWPEFWKDFRYFG